MQVLMEAKEQVNIQVHRLYEDARAEVEQNRTQIESLHARLASNSAHINSVQTASFDDAVVQENRQLKEVIAMLTN